jgi:kynurenine formamidase
MEPFYLSFFLEKSTPVYGGAKDTIIFSPITSIKNGDKANNLLLKFPNHVGTHIDFPFHFDENGLKCQDYPASFWVFDKVGFLNCRVEELPEKIKEISNDVEILFLKTGFGKLRGSEEYWKEQPVIPSSYGDLLKSAFPELRVFGFDLISLTSNLNKAEGKEAHLNFLIKNKILILEDMNLENLIEIPSKIIVSPLQIINADGVPCTVIAF